MRSSAAILATLAILAGRGFGQSAAPTALAAASDGDAASLAAGLRSLLVTFLPTPLYEDHSKWGGQKLASDGVKWRGKGFDSHPEIQYALKNDGLWQRIQLTTPLLDRNLQVDVRDVQRPSAERMLFTTSLSFAAEATYDRQRWNEGLRVSSSTLKARMQVKLTLRCESTTRIEPNGTLFPDTVFRLRVLSSDLRYEKLEVTHVAGLGGDAAKVFGEAALAAVRQVHPSLEKNLVLKVNKALVKAGDTKEVRVSLAGLLSKLGK
jgi:hypothetical protein